jgi:rifampicin phosphotransferase
METVAASREQSHTVSGAVRAAGEDPTSQRAVDGSGGRAFEAPGPGSWALDAEHCERPHSRWVSHELPSIYTEGFRAGFARYGALLETIELQLVHGYSYMAMRPVGARPDSRGTPPRALFWLITRLHPEIRRRVRRTKEVYRTRLWREDTREFFEEVMPRCIAEFERLQAVPLESLDDVQLVAHLDELVAQLKEQIHDHFLRATAPMLPVGDFIVHACEWTGCPPAEAIALLSGYSPYSVEAIAELDAVTAAIHADERAARVLAGNGDAQAVLDALVAFGGDVGAAVTRWLDRVGQRVVTGHDVGDLRGVEMPGVLLRSLRAQLAAPPREELRAHTDAATSALRARVPEPFRERFDALLEEARYVHPIRDGHSVIDFWVIGLVRRALLEAGRRLHARGRLRDAQHVVDLTHDEIRSVLPGGDGPSAEEVAGHVAWRTTHDVAKAPAELGPPAEDPPPAEWLPEPAARAARATNAYLALMFAPHDARGGGAVVRGTPASGGRATGTARLVLEPANFDRVQEGDILIARITTPSYNVLLPLLGGVVTDRGGVLSHPAIVSREFGIPGVVGTRDATARIRDGAQVEIDGDAGTVRVLAP